MMPNNLPPASPPVDTLKMPDTTSARAKGGPLFNAALLAAGKDGCNCKACQYILRLRDFMVEAAEELLDVPNG
jgi:hypothetical protein